MLVSDPLQYSEGQLWPVVPMAGQRFFGCRCEIVFAGLSQRLEKPGEDAAQGGAPTPS